MDAGQGADVRWCASRNCGNIPPPGRAFCHKCRKQRWRANNVLKSAYNTLRDHAKAKGAWGNLTLEQFAQWCEETKGLFNDKGYLELRGPHAEDMTIDRPNSYAPYEVGNMVMKTRRQNTKEGRKGKPPKYNPDDVPF